MKHMSRQRTTKYVFTTEERQYMDYLRNMYPKDADPNSVYRHVARISYLQGLPKGTEVILLNVTTPSTFKEVMSLCTVRNYNVKCIGC